MNTLQISEDESRNLYATSHDAIEVEIMDPLRDVFAQAARRSRMGLDEYIATQYAMEEIADECIEWTDADDEHPAGFYCKPDPDEFWEIIALHARVVY